MKILSHRGYWLTKSEQNTETAFRRSFELGFGTETDVRDFQGRLVISHDMADAQCLSVERFFALYKEYEGDLPLALNIKADGLQTALKSQLERFEIRNYFVFDCSIPDGLHYLKQGFSYFTRESEYEPDPAFYADASGVWYDRFQSTTVNPERIRQHVANGKAVCLVSPELHKRDPEPGWALYRELPNTLMLCTDFPERAKEFFK